MNQITSPAEAMAIVHSGHARLSLLSAATGREFTYQVEPGRQGSQRIMLTTNGRSKYPGFVTGRSFKTTASWLRPGEWSVQAFTYFWKAAVSRSERLPRQLTVTVEELQYA